MSGQRLKLAVLISGGGTTLKNLIRCSKDGSLDADVKLVVSSRPEAKGLAIARAAGIATEVVDSKKYNMTAREAENVRDWTAMSRVLDGIILKGDFDLVCMAGFLSRYLFAPQLRGRVLNIHPALVPMFCGQGMYGRAVHEAVVEAGVKVTGCTVHLADHKYDTGPILLQRCCPVYSGDTPDDVAARVFREECVAYPAAINLFARRLIDTTVDGRVHVFTDHLIERFSHVE